MVGFTGKISEQRCFPLDGTEESDSEMGIGKLYYSGGELPLFHESKECRLNWLIF